MICRKIIGQVLWFTIFVQLIFTVNASTSYVDSEDEDDWVDPFDLMNYDRHTKTKIGSRKDSLEDTELHMCKGSLMQCENHVTELQNIIKAHNNTELSSIIRTFDSKPSSTNTRCKRDPNEKEVEVYLKRFVNLFINAVGLQYVTLDQDSSQEVSFTMTVTAEQLIVLRKFGKDSSSVPLRTLDDTFTSLMAEDQSKWFSYNVKGWVNSLSSLLSSKKDLLMILVFSVPFAAFYMIMRGKNIFNIVSQITVLIFCVSLVVKYLQMFEAAEIKQYVYQRRHKDIPAECKDSSELSWWEWLTRGNIEYCQKYHEAVHIDPALQVSPHIVLSEVLSTFFLHPAENLATAIATFSKVLLGELPFGTNYLVLFITLLLIVFTVISIFFVHFGYTVSFFGFRVGGGHRAPIRERTAENLPIQGQTAPLPPNHGLSQIQWQPVINIHVGQNAAFARQESRVEEMVPPTGNTESVTNSSSSTTEIAVNYIQSKENSDDVSKSSVREIKKLNSDSHSEKSPSKSPKKLQYFENEIGQRDGVHVKSADDKTVLSSSRDASSSDSISSKVDTGSVSSTSKNNEEDKESMIPPSKSNLQTKCGSDSSDDSLETSFVKL